MNDKLFFVLNSNSHITYTAELVDWYTEPVVQDTSFEYRMQPLHVFLAPNQYKETTLLQQIAKEKLCLSLVAINSLGPRWVHAYIVDFEVVLNDPDETNPSSIEVEFVGTPVGEEE